MIQVKGVSKIYSIYHSPADRLKEIFLRRSYHKKVHALSDISFTVADGETLGIIGENGAGKSTLLKILSGVILPDEGSIEVTGKVTGLLELGTGFNSELTGKENIYMNGTLLGMERNEIDEKLTTIIEFTELGDAIEDPIKTYSSGMLMRLGFSIAIHADPACFLVDEALSVGDAYFQQKCMRKIQEFKNSGGSIVFVSHDMNAVKTLCDYAFLIDKGHMIDCREVKDVVDLYQNILIKKVHTGKEEIKIIKDIKGNNNNSGAITGEIKLISFKIFNESGEETTYIKSDEKIRIFFEIQSTKNLLDPHYGFIIRDRLGQSIFGTNTSGLNIKNEPITPENLVEITFEMNVPLKPGIYSISIGVANEDFNRGYFKEYLFFMQDVGIFTIISDNQISYEGIVNLYPQVLIENRFIH